MSIELHAFVPASQLPTVTQWQTAIDALGYPVQLDQQLDWQATSGFTPCTIEGRSSGFELDVGEPSDVAEAYPGLAALVRDTAWAITFRWGGDLQECACALAAAAGLVRCCDARVYYPSDQMWYDGPQLHADFVACTAG